MASFTGTLDKCKACDKTVYFVDLLSADGATFHKSCFKCSHCKGTLVMSNYSSMDGILYCKPHFEQLFKESGNFSKNFQSGTKPERENSLTKTPSKLSALFSGTLDKCPACSKTVYPLEKVTMEGESFHRSCFRCAHGGCPLTHSSYASLDGILYCKHHFQQLFLEKGNYQHVLKAANNKRNAAEPTEAAADEAEQSKENEEKEDDEGKEKDEPEADSDHPQEQS
ncbi:LIM domain-containing protein PLIM2b [Sesamum alatum]|uniref:LIM domain-containing protein PLIM2b n=1 Tax=Sesamum alatum TaxID=300844 RepID=A0AAE2CBF7_9LAMI|nr:LIM domain-containing protein PLIM2b [Sesamum alatum]